MEDFNEILDFIKAVGYDGKSVADEKDISEIINDGAKSKKFRDLMAWVTDEIRVLANIEEKVSGDGEINDFMIELSGFLKEMLCPFQSFISGPVSQRFLSVESRLIILDYLLTELMAMKMCHKLKPKEAVVIEVSESPAAAALKSIATTLKIGKPPNNVPIGVVFEKISTKLTEVLQKCGPAQLGSPLFNPDKPLLEKQWNRLEDVRKDLDTEYDLRRQMLITRLDVTIQSFQWSDRTQGKEDQIAARYTGPRKFLESIQYGGHQTDIVALLAARDDVAIIEKTSCANVRKNTQASIQKHVIGRVPDRGGRAYEHAPPPPEMPFWQQRNAGGQQGGGRGGGRGGAQPQRSNAQNAGGYQQKGNYQQQGNNQQQGNYQQPQGNYQQQGKGNYQPGNYQQQGKGNFQQQGNYQQPQGNYQQQGNYHQQPAGGYGNNRGSGRVQGGWSQAGAQSYDGNGQQQGGNRNSGGFGGNGGDSNYNSGGYNNGRGQSNYRRGGGGGRR